MEKTSDTPQWLEWAREIQAISQTGLHFAETRFDAERYQRLTELAAEIVAAHTEISRAALIEHFLLQPGYATPKVDVRGAIVRDGKVLLVQERTDQRWCLPGGWADVGETPSEMVVREVWEESGFRSEASRIIGVYDANRSGSPLEFFHAYKIIFYCEVTGGDARTSVETMDVDFFSFDQLPPLSEDRTGSRHLDDVRRFIENPDMAPVFD